MYLLLAFFLFGNWDLSFVIKHVCLIPFAAVVTVTVD